MVINTYKKLVIRINSWLLYVAAFVLVLIMLIVVANVILRPFGKAITGVYDLVVILTPVTIALSLAYCAIKNGHVAIGMLVERFPKRVQKIIDVIIGSISTVTLLLATWAVVQRADMMRQNNEVTTTILIPFTPFMLIIALGVGMLALVVLGKVLDIFVKEGDQ